MPFLVTYKWNGRPIWEIDHAAKRKKQRRDVRLRTDEVAVEISEFEAKLASTEGIDALISARARAANGDVYAGA